MGDGIRVDIYHHFPEGINVTFGDLGVVVEGDITVVVEKPPLPATHAVLTILNPTQGDPTMPGTITIDTAGAAAVLTFEDRINEATSAPLSSDGVTPVVVAYTSDNPAVATVDPTSGALSEVAAGTVNIGATVDDAITGSPALEPDGVTPFAPAAVNVTVNPGAAVGDVFAVTAP